MKYIYTTLLAACIALVSHGQSVFFEDFESGIPGQLTQDYVVGAIDWESDPTNVVLGPGPGVYAGDSSAFFYEAAFSGNITTLTTPTLDLSTGGFRLSFAHVQPVWTPDQNTLSVYISNDDGLSWTLVDSITVDLPTYQISEYVLADYTSTSATSKIRFSGWIDYGYAIGLDDINVFLPPSADAEAVALFAPIDGCGLGLETVAIEVANAGLDTIFGIDAAYEVGAQIETESFVVEIPPGGNDTLFFAVPADLTTAGSYDFTAYVELSGDADNTNDTIAFSVQSIPVVSSLPYNEDFESGSGGWVAGGVLSTWELGDPETAFIDTASSGQNAWVTNLDGFYNVDEQSFVESPCFDFSSLTIDPVLRFAFMVNSEPDYDGAYVEVSLDGGTTWSLLGNVGEGTNWYTNNGFFSSVVQGWDLPLGGSDEWFIATHLIDGAAGESDVKIRFYMNSDDLFNDYDGFGFDDVEVFEQPPINVSVNEIISPVTGCGLTASESVTIVIENIGDEDVVDYDLGFSIGAGDIVEMQADTLFAGEIDTITFVAFADLSVNAAYAFSAWADVPFDGDALNDSLFSAITSSPIVSSFPYSTDFESGENGWYAEGTNGIWELGAPEGVLIDTANSGINAWATNLNDTVYMNNQLSYLISPCFDFSALVIDPIIEFALISNSEIGFDGLWLEASSDGGLTWNTVGNVGDGSNWYNNADEHGPTLSDDWWDGNTQDSTEWIIADNLVTSVAGSSSVVLRFVFDSDVSGTFEGFAIDDVSITEQPAINGELTALLSPLNGCGLTSTETVEVLVTNLGSVDMDSVILGFAFDGGSSEVQVFNETLQPNETDTFTFTQTIDLNTNGEYDLVVWVETIGDGDMANDTLTTTVVSIPTITSFPYFNDFESGSGGWVSGGTSIIWELGEPEGTFIDTANSGVNAWMTVLDGEYPNLNNDTVFLESPCLDFSGLSDDPVIEFAGIFETEACCDEGWVDISLDGGLTWNKLGTSGSGENWYNDVTDDFWNGVSGAPNEWQNAQHLLDGAAGQSSVKVRFMFSSDISAVEDGFGLDDISIRPQAELDLVALSMDAPMDGCALEEEEVTITFWNKGLQDVSSFELGFRVDGGAVQTETYSGTFSSTVSSGDTVSYTFTTELADLSVAGTYSIDVFTALSGDESTDNDTVFATQITNYGNDSPLSLTEEPEDALISSAIPQGTTSEIFFCGLPENLGGCFEIVSLSIDSLNHTWLEDLDIFLISPAGDSLELSTDNGGMMDNMANVVFTDTAVNNIVTQTEGIAPGYYFPEDSTGFASLYTGQNPNGAWTLWINDDTGGDDGQLVSWTLTFQDNSPVPTVNQSDTTICVTQVLTVSVEETYDSYLWSTQNNAQEIDLFGDILGLGDTEVSVTVDQDGCTGTSESFTLTVDACIGIDELSGLSVEVYPNPTKGEVVLDISGETDGLTIEVIDVSGKVVHNHSLGSVTSRHRETIDLSIVASGIYYLKLYDGKSFVTRKLIKQ